MVIVDMLPCDAPMTQDPIMVEFLKYFPSNITIRITTRPCILYQAAVSIGNSIHKLGKGVISLRLGFRRNFLSKEKGTDRKLLWKPSLNEITWKGGGGGTT